MPGEVILPRHCFPCCPFFANRVEACKSFCRSFQGREGVERLVMQRQRVIQGRKPRVEVPK